MDKLQTAIEKEESDEAKLQLIRVDVLRLMQQIKSATERTTTSE
jgi:hypothetical protein